MKKPLPFLDRSVPEAWDRLGDVRREIAEAAATACNRLSVLSHHPVPGAR